MLLCPKMSISGFQANISTYARGKLWYWYAIAWLIGIYAYVQLFQFDMVKGQMPFVLLVPYSFDFLLHELAHIFTAFLPPVLTASAGSVSELLLGSGLVIMAFWQRSYFAALFCLLWLDLTCQSAGQYMADAIPERLPLISLGGALSGQDPVHDWHFVFGELHLLDASVFIGNSVRFVGMFAGLFGVVFAAWLLYVMSRGPALAEVGSETVFDASPPESRPSSNNPPSPSSDDGFTSLSLSSADSSSDTSGRPAQPPKPGSR